jgi:molybdopterin molybdotransferase
MSQAERGSPYPVLAVEEAQQVIADHTGGLLDTEDIVSLEALGRVLASDIDSSEPVPDVPKSLVDGYAVCVEDAGQPRRILAEVIAGAVEDVALEPGTAVRIMTGAPLPDGTDAVVMLEHTEENDTMLYVQHEPGSGDNIRAVGDDIAAGTRILEHGKTLQVADIGVLAAAGCTWVKVYRRPLVAILSSGNEVVEPDALRRPGMVRDSNRYALMVAVEESGGTPLSLGIARDDPAVQRAALQRGLAQADVVITSGGVSVGTYDFIKPLLEEMGTVHIGRVASKPGKHVTFATVGEKVVFGLPGFPVSSLVSFEVYVRPVLRRIQGDMHPQRPRLRVVLNEPVSSDPTRVAYQRVVIHWHDGRLVATTTGQQASTRLLSMIGANGLLIVPPGERTYQPGEELEALVTGQIKRGEP